MDVVLSASICGNVLWLLGTKYNHPNNHTPSVLLAQSQLFRQALSGQVLPDRRSDWFKLIMIIPSFCQGLAEEQACDVILANERRGGGSSRRVSGNREVEEGSYLSVSGCGSDAWAMAAIL